AVVVVPRLTVRVVGFGGPPPIGDAWRDTAVVLPAWNRDAARTMNMRELFTRQSRTVSTGDAHFPVADALRAFPVALWMVSAR
ncbi:MAG TPA: hypothetical protein VM165_00045, partial [Planctomycetaceae bacterium]|nr:hypothetical protein [Planctomycetaceae bacterium]